MEPRAGATWWPPWCMTPITILGTSSGHVYDTTQYSDANLVVIGLYLISQIEWQFMELNGRNISLLYRR
jgi:hypothetical protein